MVQCSLEIISTGAQLPRDWEIGVTSLRSKVRDGCTAGERRRRTRKGRTPGRGLGGDGDTGLQNRGHVCTRKRGPIETDLQARTLIVDPAAEWPALEEGAEVKLGLGCREEGKAGFVERRAGNRMSRRVPPRTVKTSEEEGWPVHRGRGNEHLT